MLRFAHPELLWGLLLLAVPLAIHLIQRLRQHRIEWAAMEFLLESQRMHRTSIRLRELVLLLLRMLAVAGLVLLVARPAWNPDWAAALGGSRTHQIVLLDDSLSMSDTSGARSTFARAGDALASLAGRLMTERRGCTVTLARFSGIARDHREWHTELKREIVDAEFAQRITELASAWTCGEHDVRPAAALESALALVDDRDPVTEVWLLTDGRAANWTETKPYDAALAKLAAARVQVHVVTCADRPRANLAVTELGVRSGFRVASVPLEIEVAVQNFSDRPAERVVVELARGEGWQPALSIDRVEPRQKVTRSIPWTFGDVGSQTLAARVSGDALAADNRRFAVVETKAELPVLILDDDPTAGSARFLSLALAPDGRAATGLAARIEPEGIAGSESLDEFSAIYLTHLTRLDRATSEGLRSFVLSGGGLAVFVGPQTDFEWVTTQAYQGGSGWFPLPLSGIREIPKALTERSTDLLPDDLQLFRVFAGQRNSFLQSVHIERLAATSEGWEPKPADGVQVLARTRGGHPLVVEKRLGRGRVVAFLTTAAPLWNDWGRNPSFVVTLLELQARLISGRVDHADLHVGDALAVEIPAAPTPGTVSTGTVTTGAVRFDMPGESAAPQEIVAQTISGGLQAVLSEATRSGIYRAQWQQGQGTASRLLAVNVSSSEGDLVLADLADLRQKFQGWPIEFTSASGWQWSADVAGLQATQFTILLLAVVLAGEQWLARAAGYHPASQEARR